MSLSKSGYIKAVAVHMKTSLGRPMENAKEIVRQVMHYTKNQADLIVFGELSISGYSCGDLFLQSFMEEQCRMAITYLCDNLPQSDTLIAVGAPLRKDGMLFNTALIFKGNELLGIVPKTFVPNYKEFYEKRWFAGADQRFSDTIRYDEIFYDEGASLNGERTFPFTPNLIIEGRNGIRLACEICEDLWVNIPPSSFHASAGANVIANLSASNDVVTKPEYRRDLVRMQSGTNMCAYVYCSSGSGESTTDLIFSGHNIIAANGTILADSNKEATEALIDLERINNDRIKNNSISYAAARYSQMASNGKGYVRLHTQTSSVAHWPESLNPYPFVPSEAERAGRCKEIMRLQATGLAERLTKIGIRKCVIGVSGGLDSTLALLVIKEAYDMLGWPLTDIIGITMPGFGTTDLTKTNSWKLMEQLGITIRMINITDACLQHFEDIVFKGFGGVLCVESGGPTPGVGCAGRGIISAFEKLEELEAFETYQPDIVIYDVLGDVVCGGFAMPIRGGYAKDVYVVSSGEMMSLYAANNIASAIRNFGKRGYAQLRGLILNAKNIENEREIVAKAVEEIGTQVVCYVPRSPEIQEAENQGGTVFEFLTNSVMQGVYNELADRILADA